MVGRLFAMIGAVILAVTLQLTPAKAAPLATSPGLVDPIGSPVQTVQHWGHHHRRHHHHHGWGHHHHGWGHHHHYRRHQHHWGHHHHHHRRHNHHF